MLKLNYSKALFSLLVSTQAAAELPLIVDFGKLKPFCHIAANKDEDWQLGHLVFNAAPEIGSIITFLKKNYEIDTVVETGTFQGNTTIFFSYLFDDVHTIELNPITHEMAKNKFLNYKNVTCHKGSSDLVLKSLLPQLKDKKILFYLDACWNKYWPLLREIEEIGKTHKDNCIIVVDDVKVPNRDDVPFDKHEDVDCSYEHIKEKVQSAFSKHSVHYLIPSKKESKAKLIILPEN